jgi:hypothetical protein
VDDLTPLELPALPLVAGELFVYGAGAAALAVLVVVEVDPLLFYGQDKSLIKALKSTYKS